MRLFAASLVLSLLGAGGLIGYARDEPKRRLAALEKDGRIEPLDVVFQDLECGLRCDLIREVTASRFTHMGIVLEEHGQRMVWEAFGPVAPVPLAEWISRTSSPVAVYRFDDELKADGPAIASEVRNMAGLPYDGDYQWDDDRIYCSELVAKAVKRATGISLSLPRTFSFGAEKETVSRMSRGRLTESTEIVAPVDLARSRHLRRIAGGL